MSDFYWVRHGPTHAKTFVGWRDLPADLSDSAQIARLSGALPADASVISSDLQRSEQTADAICGARTRLPSQPMLREFHFGAWDGMGFDAIAARYPEDSRRYWERPGDVAPLGGESWNAAAHRVSVATDHLARRYAGQPLIVVAHIGVILTQLQRALGITAEDVLAHRIDNLSVTRIDLRGAAPEVGWINHLP